MMEYASRGNVESAIQERQSSEFRVQISQETWQTNRAET